jgi:hypothetical protein
MAANIDSSRSGKQVNPPPLRDRRAFQFVPETARTYLTVTCGAIRIIRRAECRSKGETIVLGHLHADTSD